MSLAELTSLEAYHADTSRVSNSMLRDFRKSPALFYGRYIAKTIPPKEDTDSTIRGTLLHLSQSAPETWRDRFAISPPLAPDGKKWLRRKGSDHERWWAEFQAQCQAEGKWDIPAEERDTILAMGRALLADPIAGPMLTAGGQWEQTIHWTDQETGLPCKCRPDLLVPGLAICDLKTASDPSPEGFNRAVERYGYAHQAEHYRAGCIKQYGDEAIDFLFIVVGTEPPHDVLVTRLDLDWQAIGREENRRDLRRLADCYAFQQWHAPTRGQITTLSPPKWRLHQWEDHA